MFTKMCVFIFCIFFVLLVNANSEELGTSVTIKQGTVIGKYMKSREGKQFSAFLSIPYAEPPIGHLRFKAPVAAKPWSGNLNASVPHAICPQIDLVFQPNKVEGDENCLFLSIYTPKVATSHLYPVMMFIHGGGFFSGSGQMYKPDYLIDEDVVLVTFNYRLGALGFLSTGDKIVPGNNGLKDQALAIKWVYENIKAFGGDPEKITLFGESAGAVSVHFHMFSPLSQSYIKAAISQSGTVFHHWALQERELVVYYSEETAKHFGCLVENHKKMVECLRSVDAIKLIESQKSFVEWDIEPAMLFIPVVEENTSNAFLPDHPLRLLKTGKYANIPWMTGVTSEEGLLRVSAIFKKQKLIEDLDQDFSRVIKAALNNKNPKFESIAKKIKEFYFGNKKIDNSAMYDAGNLYSDLMFIPATDAAVNLHFQYSKQPVYYYLLTHTGRNSFAEIFGRPSLRYGTCHADELILQFPLSHFFGYAALDNYDTYYSKLINKLWANFAKSGNPTPELDPTISSKWRPVETENLEYLCIGGGLHTASNLYPERINFWRNINSHMKINIRDEL